MSVQGAELVSQDGHCFTILVLLLNIPRRFHSVVCHSEGGDSLNLAPLLLGRICQLIVQAYDLSGKGHFPSQSALHLIS